MSDFFDLDPEMQELIHRFEDAVKRNSILYFDVDDLESIVDSYIAQDDNVKARVAIDYALRVHPDSPELKCKEAKVLLCEGHYRSAADMLAAIPNLEPDYVAIMAECNLRMRHFNIARSLFNQYLTSCDPDELDQIFVDIATLYNSYKRPDIALEFLDNAVVLFPDDKDILTERAFAFEQLAQYDEAIKIYNKVLSIDPYSSEIWSLLGSMYFAKKDFVEAIKAYDYALAINPDDAATKLQRAHCLFNLDRYDEAVEPYCEYVEANPNDVLVATFLGETYENLDDFADAEDIYKHVIELDSSIYEAWVGLASCYLNTHLTELAYSTIKAADNVIPENQQIIYFMSRVESELAELKDDEKYVWDALDHMMFCLKNDPENVRLIFEAGTLFFQVEKYSRAKQLLELAFELDPYIENISIFLAMTYYAVGDYSRCRLFYAKAKETIANAESIFLSIFPDAKKCIK